MPLADGQDFLRREYELMLSVKELNQIKPVVALADGFVLGAGAGAMLQLEACRHQAMVEDVAQLKAAVGGEAGSNTERRVVEVANGGNDGADGDGGGTFGATSG